MSSHERLIGTARALLLSIALVVGLMVGAPTQAQASPKAPSGLTRASYSNNAVRLTWKAVKGAAAYQVKYASNSKLKKASYVTVTAAVAEIGGLKAGKNYYFKVQALKADGKALTKYSKTKKIKTRSKKSYSALSPAGLRASENRGDELTLVWAPQGAANRYLVRWSTKKSMKGAKSQVVSGPTTFVEGLKRATPYYLTIAAVNAKNKVVSQTTSPLKVTTAKLITFGTPGSIALSKVNPTDLTVTWATVRKAPAYRVAYAPDNWNEPTYINTVATAVRLETLIANTDYLVKVQAVDAAGQPAGEFSRVATAHTPRQDAELRVASYNVRAHNNSPDPGDDSKVEKPWVVRRDYVAGTIVASNLDVVSLQEAQQSLIYDSSNVRTKTTQFEDLRDRLVVLGQPWALTDADRYNCKKSTEQETTSDGRPSPDCEPTDQGASRGTKIVYRTDRLVLLTSGSMGLTKAYPEDDPSTTVVGDPSYTRFLVWAVFKQRSTGKQFLFADMHLEPDDDLVGSNFYALNRQQQARDALAELGRVNTSNLPVVLAGDAAASRADKDMVTGKLWNPPYEVFTKEGGLIDPLGNTGYNAPVNPTVETRDKTNYNSYNQFKLIAPKDPSGRLNGTYNDYILTTPMRVSEFAQVLNVDAGDNFIGVIPSDHNLIRASLWLP